MTPKTIINMEKGNRNMGKGTIMIEPCAGLGNRLLALTSAYELSKKLDKELTVIWKRRSAVRSQQRICLR